MEKQSIQLMANAKKEFFVLGVEEGPSIPQRSTMRETFCPAQFFIEKEFPVFFLFFNKSVDQNIVFFIFNP